MPVSDHPKPAPTRIEIAKPAPISPAEPLFAGRDPEVVGAVLADLLAMLLAGHVGEDAAALREQLLEVHIAAVRRLIPVNVQIMLANMTPAGRS